MLLAFLAIALTVQDSSEVFYRKGHLGVIAPTREAAVYAVVSVSKTERDFYRVVPLANSEYEVIVNSGHPGSYWRDVAKILGGRIVEDGMYVAKSNVDAIAANRPPRVSALGDKTVLDADESGIHETIFALMSFASKSYQVGPFRGGGGKVVIHVKSTTLESNLGYVLRQVEGIFLQDGDEWIVLDGSGLNNRKSAGYKAMDRMLDNPPP